ncbi:MAG: acyltransferase [Treponema sp.]|nr:acyltransferase [Candidatus Treponema merdequi]
MEQKITQINRKLYFDIIRIIALLSIVMVHVSAYLVIKYPDPRGTIYIISDIFNGISRAGVPLFIMLSGALLLNEDKPFDTKRFYKGSLLWMVLLFIGWLLFYAAFYAFILPSLTGGTSSWQMFADFILSFKGTDYPHLWYMFMIVGGYLMIPVLRLFVKRENRNYIFWMIVGSIIIQFAAKSADTFVTSDAIINVSGFMKKFHMEPLTGYTGYFLLGWYLSEFDLKKASRILIYSVTVILLTFSIFALQQWVEFIPAIREKLYEELSLTACFFGISFFILIKTLFKEKESKSKLLTDFSKNSFGMYMIHIVYLELFTKVWFPYDKVSAGVIAYILITCFADLALSYITVWAVGKIPLVKKIFYLK